MYCMKLYKRNNKKHSNITTKQIDRWTIPTVVNTEFTYNNNLCIILTMTVEVNNRISTIFQKNKEDRLQLYIQSIRNWLLNTNFNIVIVENSGYLFDEINELYKKNHDRMEIVSFKENDISGSEHLKKNSSKGYSEIFAIQYAYHNSKLLQSSEFIIKITGRYFIPNLYEYLLNVNLNNYKILCQCTSINNSTRCEMIGCKKDYFYKIFDLSLKNNSGENVNDLIESLYYERIRKIPYNQVFICKKFEITPTQRGGINDTFSFI